MDNYERDLTPEEEDALAAQMEAERLPYEIAAAQARDLYFGFAEADDALDHAEQAQTQTPAPA
ncbi:hypothetical protein [Sphingobium sp. CR2-8]|uniref:hypothetical protein n=1 Tax=Sphingobium sp. CR2-8 TaxID=1306534 RepID=UPI003FA37917